MNRVLDLLSPALAVLTLLCAITGYAPTWLLAAATLAAANWRVSTGGRVIPAAAAAALTVMALLWAYGALAFMLILLAVIVFATLVRVDRGEPPAS